MLQSSERGQTFFLPNRKGGYCNRNISFVLFTFYRLESRSSSPLQTGAKDRGWKWSSSMIPSLPSRSSGASGSFYQFGKWIKIYSLCCFLATLHVIDCLDHPSDTKVLNDPACVLDFPTNCVTAVSLTAGTEKPFSSCKLWYRRRPVGWQLPQLMLLVLSCRNESLSNCFPRLSHLIHTLRCAETHSRRSDRRLFVFRIPYCGFKLYSSFKVLFIADAKIGFDSFRNGMAATINCKSIITVNPGELSQLFFQTEIWLDKWSGALIGESDQTVHSVGRGGEKNFFLLWSSVLSVCCCPIMYSQTPERPACCSATLRKYLSPVLWIKMRGLKM